MFNTVKLIAFWLVILLSAVLLWQVVKAGGTGVKEMEIAFSKFMQDVDRGEVYSVTLSGSEVHGKYKDGNVSFRTTAPAINADLIRDLREKDVSIVVKDGGGSNYLLNLSPLILFAVLWFFMIRQIKSGTKVARVWRSAADPPPLSAVEQGGESLRQSPRLVLVNSAGALAFGHCRSQNGQITFYPEAQIGPVVAWMLAPIPPAEMLGSTK